MTRSSSGPGRQPGRPFKDEEKRQTSFAHHQEESDNQIENMGDGTDGTRVLRADGARSRRPARRMGEVQTAGNVAFTQVNASKRGIALMIDVISAFVLSLVCLSPIWLINLIIPIERVLPLTQQTVIMALMLCRDYFFQGRGIGKNLLGFKVVDASTGQRPSLLQSIKRNILFFVPMIFLSLTDVVKFLPLGGFNGMIFHAIQLFCTVYVIVFIPAECWLAFKREDGRRIGDRLANTGVIESNMDFSKLI